MIASSYTALTVFYVDDSCMTI